MENLKKQFVSYELAEILQKIGFNEPCLSAYSFSSKKLISFGYYENNGQLLAPTFQQIIDWLRVEHSIFAYIETDIIHGSEIHTGKILGTSEPIEVFEDSGDYYKTYELLINIALNFIK